ncbi:MAG: geranylgeranyl diphosphate reductase [Gammaproteobacteria bacterium]|jgi:geranylgeranyl reductase|nr:geranylgeranyl diphosphate reductase [Gammaproteobacteria bacterium]
MQRQSQAPGHGEVFDVVVVGGGPAGATAANELAGSGRSVLLLDRGGRIKPCGGAVPPILLEEFDVPDSLLVARSNCARMISPKSAEVDMPINGFVGMVDREHFDEWLRERAARSGAVRRAGRFKTIEHDREGRPVVVYKPTGPDDGRDAEPVRVTARLVIGADGARSEVARQNVPGAEAIPFVAAYHEIVSSPPEGTRDFSGSRCDVYYQGELSPDFYAWIFPHGDCTSVGVGTANKGFSMREAVTKLRERSGMGESTLIRREGAPIPLRTLKRWDNARDVLLAGDAAGCVAPASGEGIYYAMFSGRIAAQTADEFCRSGDARVLRSARKRFMKAHGRVFWILGIMQRFWYNSDKRRERFVSICRDPDVQHLTWEAYMYKRLVKARPTAHVRIFFKDMAHLLGFASVK